MVQKKHTMKNFYRSLFLTMCLFSVGCSQKFCGSPSTVKSWNVIQQQRSYGLSFQADSSIFVMETLKYETRKYQLYEVWIGDVLYSVEYFAPTRKEPGFARVAQLNTGRWLDCDEMQEVLRGMKNQYPF